MFEDIRKYVTRAIMPLTTMNTNEYKVNGHCAHLMQRL